MTLLWLLPIPLILAGIGYLLAWIIDRITEPDVSSPAAGAIMLGVVFPLAAGMLGLVIWCCVLAFPATRGCAPMPACQ